MKNDSLIVCRVWLVSALLLLSACQTGSNHAAFHVSDLFQHFQDGGSAFNILNSFAAVQRDFEHGRIMRARARVLALDPTHQDYAQAQYYLKQTIEPARRRVFLHYLHAAQRAEKAQRWDAAMAAYDQAKSVTIKPVKMEKKRLEMEWKMRQLRVDKLLSQRRKEDAVLFNVATLLASPKGVNANDVVYARLRDLYHDTMDDRARLAYREAKRYLRKDLPEIAYVEIESYLRLQPDSAPGKKILAEIKHRLPDTLVIRPTQGVATKPRQITFQRTLVSAPVTAKQIKTAIDTGDLQYAEQLAQLYRRKDGKGAEALLAQVQAKLDVKAAALFAQGGAAFGRENLDEAMKYWREAVALRVDNAEYREALRRARQLKERLVLLREQKAALSSQHFIKPIAEEQ